MPASQVTVRRARTRDVARIRCLVDSYSGERRVLGKSTVNLYEDVQEFCVAEIDANTDAGTESGPERTVVGCGALHVLWEDLAEVRTVVVDPVAQGRGAGHAIVSALLDRARELGVRRVFCLTFETAFFARHGFQPIQGAPVSPRVYDELLRSYDEGVAEFLDLERAKPNTLGNTRMLVYLNEPGTPRPR